MNLYYKSVTMESLHGRCARKRFSQTENVIELPTRE